jgi:hypothetical protein
VGSYCVRLLARHCCRGNTSRAYVLGLRHHGDFLQSASTSPHRRHRRMKYRYSVVSGQMNIDGRYTKRPVVEVVLSKGNRQRTFLALIDSGADQIMMPAAIAEVFGIESDACLSRTSMRVSMEPIEGFISHLSFQLAHQADVFEAPVAFIDRHSRTTRSCGIFRPLPPQIRAGSRHIRNYTRTNSSSANIACGQFSASALTLPSAAASGHSSTPRKPA